MKVQAQMRVWWPKGRIIHELVLQQGGVRLDVACVTEDHICVAEIKSSKDVLKRLENQVKRAVEVADEVWVCFALKHAFTVKEMVDRSYRDTESWDEYRRRTENGWQLSRSTLFLETVGGLSLEGRRHDKLLVDPRIRFDLLWADEMRSALSRHFGGASTSRWKKLDRHSMAKLAVEHMTGAELRRAVCAQLRNRPFPRADPPAGDLTSEGEGHAPSRLC
ncbi:MAG: hypothetical protein KKA05_11845 [Alphaproteobacteria bacterium]|nr:hypothetical protein [Alphaproteobacteria bacterium]